MSEGAPDAPLSFGGFRVAAGCFTSVVPTHFGSSASSWLHWQGFAFDLCSTGFDMTSLCSESAASDHKGDKEEQKLEFTLKALESPDPFEQHAQLPADVTEAMYWQAARSPEEVIGEREVIMQRLEAADRVMRKNGLCDKWLEGADLEVKRVAASVNGIILEDLCRPKSKCP